MTFRPRTALLAGAFLLVGAALAVYFIYRPVKSEPAGYKAPLVISVQAFYPGANAQTVADTVAAPIEERVNGVEHMLSMASQSANDGRYSLYVTFEPGADLDMAQVLVQNRVSLALPALPAPVQREGISVRKKALEPLLLVALTAPGAPFDDFLFSNFTAIDVKDGRARLPGVGDVVLFGQRDDRMRVALDADKLAALQLSALDVVTALRAQNLEVAGEPIGQAPVPKGQQLQLTVNTLGARLTKPEELESVIVKNILDGTIRLKDVAWVGLVSAERSSASLNGKPAILLSIYPLPTAKPSDVSRAVLDKIAKLRPNLPDGLALAVAFDFAPNLEEPKSPATAEHLVIDAELPENTSAERTVRALERAAKLLRQTPGVEEVLALTEHPFSLVRNRPCLVVRLTPNDQRELDREQIAGNVRVTLPTEVPEAVFRLSVSSTAEGLPVYGFPIELAIEDRGGQGSASLRECAGAIVEKMSQSGKFSDVGVGPGLRRVSVLNVTIDRTTCLDRGVEINEIVNTLQVNLGPARVSNFKQVGRTWQMNMQVDRRLRGEPSAIRSLQVRNKQNQPVRLGTVMAVRYAVEPMVIERHNMYPIARITANRAASAPLAEAKSLCETLAEQEFGTKQFKLIWRAR